MNAPCLSSLPGGRDLGHRHFRMIASTSHRRFTASRRVRPQRCVPTSELIITPSVVPPAARPDPLSLKSAAWFHAEVHKTSRTLG